jgi:hypothetical protein
MADNLIEAQYDITKKTKLKKFFEKNKIFIYLFTFVLVVFFVSFGLYLESKGKKKVLISESYLQAKIYLGNNKKAEALDILKTIILTNDQPYSALSFFMILDQSLIKDQNEVISLFNHLLENNKFDKEIKNLLIYKKALYSSNYLDETELLTELKPLLNKKEILWKGHALLLLGNYFVSKKEYMKAKDFYNQVLSTNNLQKNLYDQAKLQLELIANK